MNGTIRLDHRRRKQSAQAAGGVIGANRARRRRNRLEQEVTSLEMRSLELEHLVEENTLGVDLPAGGWHTVVCLETGTLFYETKPGPFCPIPEEDMAPWAPAEGDGQVGAYLQSLVDAVTS